MPHGDQLRNRNRKLRETPLRTPRGPPVRDDRSRSPHGPPRHTGHMQDEPVREPEELRRRRPTRSLYLKRNQTPSRDRTPHTREQSVRPPRCAVDPDRQAGRPDDESENLQLPSSPLTPATRSECHPPHPPTDQVRTTTGEMTDSLQPRPDRLNEPLRSAAPASPVREHLSAIWFLVSLQFPHCRQDRDFAQWLRTEDPQCLPKG